MDRIEIYKQITIIYKQLSEINTPSYETYRRIIELYGEYLKLLVQIQSPIPNPKRDYRLFYGNCYFYAFGLPIVYLFRKKFSKIFKPENFELNVGDISGLNILEAPNNKEDLLECLYSDLDFLKIRFFESDISSSVAHEGYKVGIFFNSYDEDGDYHFIRQNANGLWSQQFGFRGLVYWSDNPIEELEAECYEYVKTIEIVKPTLQRLQ